jgi:hypothetical protein
MNQVPTDESVKGDFNDDVLKLPDSDVLFTRRNGDFLMVTRQNGQELRAFKVQRTIGSRNMQFYAGVQVSGPEPPEHAVYRPNSLPFAYSYRLKQWYPRTYFDPVGNEKLGANGNPYVEGVHGLEDVRSYTKICMNCHNTYPYAYRAVQPVLNGFPGMVVQTAVEPLAQALPAALQPPGTLAGFEALNERLDPDKDLSTVGISCESCHFGGEEHAKSNGKIKFLPTSKFIRLEPLAGRAAPTGDRKDPVTIVGLCAQCHSGSGAAMFPNNSCSGNSREARDMVGGHCASQIKCTDCHEPHTKGPPSGGGPDLVAHVEACAKCHTKYNDPAAALAHSGHPASAGVNCLDCHMPRYGQGLEDLIRSHRIASPVEEVMVANGYPNACNLCHLDKSLGWTLQETKRIWNREIKPQPGWSSFATLDKPQGQLWLDSGEARLRLLGRHLYARSPLGKATLPKLLDGLNDAEPCNRLFTCLAVEKVLGRNLTSEEIRITDPPPQRAASIERLKARADQLAEPPPAGK